MSLADQDQERLDFAFRDTETADDRHERVCAALGLDFTAVRALAREILGDLRGPMESTLVGPDGAPAVSEGAYGIWWWTGYSALATQRRICIGDYLHEVTHAIEINLLEARLHLSALRKALTAAGTMRPARGMDYFHGSLAQIHVAGMLRAVVSAADCLAAVGVGVLGLPLDIKRADLGRVVRWRRERAPRLAPGPAAAFLCLGIDNLTSALEGASPPGWLAWATTYRNTFVHRGRRHQHWHPGVGLRLPVEPDHSELEALLGGHYPGCLREPCEVTLAGIMVRIERAISVGSFALLLAWRTRRDDPTLVVQPREQWPNPPRVGSGPGFDGFDPRDLPAVDAAVASPTTLHRYRAAAVDARVRHLWRTFS